MTRVSPRHHQFRPPAGLAGLALPALAVAALLWAPAPAAAEGQAVRGVGVNLSGLEYPWAGYPDSAHLDYIRKHGVTFIRLPIAWERLSSRPGGSLDLSEVTRLQDLLDRAASRGLSVIIDIHSYGRFNPDWAKKGPDGRPTPDDALGTPAVPVAAFRDFWTRLARELAGRPGLVGYDLMNEPQHLADPAIWPAAAQAAVDGIRTVDRKTTIYVEGYQWASARNWRKFNGNLHITDPENNIVYEAHQYFDDGSGEYNKSYDKVGASPDSGAAALRPFLEWLKENNARGFLGEFAVPYSDPRWMTVLDNVVLTLKDADLPATYWYYAYADPTGNTPWWPPRDGPVFDLGLVPFFPAGTDKPQWRILQKHR